MMMSFSVSDDPNLKPIFGVPIATAVDRSKCHDGIQLPVIFRECIDFIEEFGKLMSLLVNSTEMLPRSAALGLDLILL